MITWNADLIKHGKNWNQFSSLCYNKICISGWYWIFYAFNLRLEFTILILGCFPFTLASIHRGVLQEEFGSLRKPQHGLRVHHDQARGGAAEVRDHIAHTVWETNIHIAHTVWDISHHPRNKGSHSSHYLRNKGTHSSHHLRNKGSHSSHRLRNKGFLKLTWSLIPKSP